MLSDPHRVYAEVLFPFKAGGPQELCLEKGALVEVLRVEPGPWWWGRIQHDAILTNKSSNQLEGWFPKDFVKVSGARFEHWNNIRRSASWRQ